MDRQLVEAFRFFHEHAGYVVGLRAVGALSLARAELRAKKLGLTVTWEDEDHAWDADCPAPPIHVWARVNAEGSRFPLASLGGIGLMSWRDLSEAARERDVADTQRASELASRATYAG